MKIEKVEAVPADFALRNPFRTALGQKTTTRNVIVKVGCGSGLEGWGEASSSLAMPEATQKSMLSTLRACSALAQNQRIVDWKEICVRAAKKFKDQPTAISALECALLDAFCRAKKMPLRRFFGTKTKPVLTSYTISALNNKTTGGIVRKLSRNGFHKFKIKVTGKNPELDFQRIQTAARHCGREKLIIDANQGWNREQAAAFIERLYKARLPVSVIEQPVNKQDAAAMAFVKKRSPFPIAADESVRSFSDLKKILDADAADIINIKIAKLGLLPSLKIAEAARKAGKKLMIGCMMESVVGLATSVSWAIGSGIFDHVDLDSFLLLKRVPFRSGFSNLGPKIFIKGKCAGSGTESI